MPPYALRKPHEPSAPLPRGCAMISSSTWPSRGIPHRVARGRAQHTDDGRRSIHTFPPRDSISCCLAGDSEPGPRGDSGRLRERPGAENCRGSARTRKCVLRNSQSSSCRRTRSRGSNRRSRRNCKNRAYTSRRAARKSAWLVTLSENFKNLVWTAEIHKGDVSQVVLDGAERASGKSRRLERHARVHPQRKILGRAGAHSGRRQKSPMALGNPGWCCSCPMAFGFRTSKPAWPATIEIISHARREPRSLGKTRRRGKWEHDWFSSSPRDVRGESGSARFERVSADGGRRSGTRRPHSISDRLAPPGLRPRARGPDRNDHSDGRRSQFLATGGRDYTQTDSVQVFEKESGGSRRGERGTGFPGADHGLACAASKRPGPSCAISRLEIMKRIVCPFPAGNSSARGAGGALLVLGDCRLRAARPQPSTRPQVGGTLARSNERTRWQPSIRANGRRLPRKPPRPSAWTRSFSIASSGSMSMGRFSQRSRFPGSTMRSPSAGNFACAKA